MRERFWWSVDKLVDGTAWLRRKVINQEIRTITLQAVPFWIASLLTGIVAVGYEKLFSAFERAGRLLVEDAP